MKEKTIIRTSNFINTENFIKKIISSNKIGVIVGEKGSGKTFIKTKVLGRMQEDAHKYRVIEVGVIGEQVKNITSVMSSMITGLSGENPNRDVEARRKQLRRVLGTAASQYEVVLTIDEAQDLHHSTLRSLKKIHELAFGTMDRLFSIILFAQPSLVPKISDDELKPRFKRYAMQKLTEEEKAKFIPNASIFTKEALALFLKRTRQNPLSVEESYSDLEDIKLEFELKQIERKHVEDYFSVDLREKILGFGMSFRKLSSKIGVSATALHQVSQNKYPGDVGKIEAIINEYEEKYSKGDNRYAKQNS